MESTNPAKPGIQTSEFKVTMILIIIGIVLDALGIGIAQAKEAFPNATWLGAGLIIVGVLTKIVTGLKYMTGRVDLKGQLIHAVVESSGADGAEALKAFSRPKGFIRVTFLLILAGLCLLSMPAFAQSDNPLHIPLVQHEERQAGLAAGSVIAISDVLYFRPSFDVTVATCGGLEGKCSLGLTPGVSGGLGWAPPGWQKLRERAPYLPLELAALDAHFSAELTGDSLRVQALLMLSLGPVTVGGGPDVLLGSTPVQLAWRVAMGARYAF